MRSATTTLALLALASLAASLAGCGEGSEPAEPASSTSAPLGRPIPDRGLASNFSPAPDPGPGSALPGPPKRTRPDFGTPPSPLPGCKDIRHLGDGKNPYDGCWDPPLHYCSNGVAAAFGRMCKPDGSLCCLNAPGCVICGWVDCGLSDGNASRHPAACKNAGEMVKFGSGGVPSDPPECEAFRFEPVHICWDDIDAQQ